VINRKLPEGEYVTSWSQFEFLPGALDGLCSLARLEVPIIIATNQRGIALGRMSESDLAAIHAAMLEAVGAAGGRIDAIFHCPHDTGCACRKPLPGMLLDAAGQFGFDLTESALIGDSESDMQAAQAVGAYRILVGGDDAVAIDADAWVPDLPAAAETLRNSSAIHIRPNESDGAES
jgi:D-glycero-D-manno-heptose 1,7-bisphosphate phosphatase